MNKEKFERVEHLIRNMVDGKSEKYWHVFIRFETSCNRLVEGFLLFPLEKGMLDLVFSRIIEYEDKWILGPEDVGSLQFSISMLDIRLMGQADIHVFSECFDIPVVRGESNLIRMEDRLFIFGEFPDELTMEDDINFTNPNANK